jgi:LytR cell envelope-related transcriptional attenuator
MTAPAAAIVAALHVSDRIKDYGSYAGFAAILGLAVLSLLYFAQAREVKRLREWAGRAPERDAELQARVTADAQQRTAPAAAPAPVAAAATAAAAKPAAVTAPKPTTAPAPAPTPAPAPATAAATAAGAASASPAKPEEKAPQKSEDGKDPGATPAPGTPASTPAAPATAGNGTVDQPTQITPPPRPAPKPGQPLRAPAGLPPADDHPPQSPLRTTLMVIGGVVAVAAIVVLLVTVVFSGGDDKGKPNTIGGTSTGTSQGSTDAGSKSAPNKTTPVSRGDVTVAVLNGTTVPGLARGAATKLQSGGFKIGTVTNAPDQARSATAVAYQPGHQDEARVVARLIGVGSDAIKPIDQSTQVVAGQEAFVVVTVGADQSR